MKNLYLINPKIKWPAFKKLHDRMVHDPGPKPENIEKVLWRMLRDKQIMCGFSGSMPGDMWIGLSVKGWKVKAIIGNSKGRKRNQPA